MSLLPNATNADSTKCYFVRPSDLYLNISTLNSTIEGDIQSTIKTWSQYPAIGNVNFANFEILSTSSIQLDGVFLSATPDELLINGIPVLVSTMYNVSSIAEWSYYDALSTVFMGNNLIQDCTGIELNGNQITSGAGNTIQVNGQNPVAVWSGYAATGNLNMNNNNIGGVNSLSAVTTIITSNVCATLTTNKARINQDMFALSTSFFNYAIVSSLTASTITVPTVRATNITTSNVTTSNVILSNATNSNTLTTTGTTLLYNGATVNTGAAGNVALWANYNAVGTVRSQQGYGGSALECIGKSYFNGDVQMRSFTGGSINVEFDRSSADGPFFKVNSAKFYATGSYNQMGQSNAVLPYQSVNYILGQTFIDGGTVRPISIGCLPTPVGPPINTQRIDVTPAGILLTTPTFITMNGLGAANIAMSGAVAIGAGSYITLEHGFGLGSNGVYVQVAGRNDTARLLLEFGGSVGPSIDNPGNAAKVDFHGTNLFIQTITNTFAGNRWPRKKDIFIDSVSTLAFINNTKITAKPNFGLELSTANVYVSSLTAKGTMNAYNVSSVNVYVESMFSLVENGQINVYDNLAGSKAIFAQTILGAPTVRTSTIYGTSGASVDGQLFLQTPLVTATNNLRVTNTLYSEDARFQGQTTVSSIQSFVGTPVTFDNAITNMPNSATISTLTVQTVNGLPYPVKNPIVFIEQATVVTLYTLLAVPLASSVITLPFASRIWVTVNTTFDNTGSGASDYIVSEYIQIGSTAYNPTQASIPARFSPSVPSSTGISVQVVSAELPAGTYSISAYAFPNVINTDLTAVHSDIVATGGY